MRLLLAIVLWGIKVLVLDLSVRYARRPTWGIGWQKHCILDSRAKIGVSIIKPRCNKFQVSVNFDRFVRYRKSVRLVL